MDSGLKQRIIGAVVLVIAAVVFLPMLLTGQDETTRVEVEAPDRPVMDESEIEVAAPMEPSDPDEPVMGVPPTPLPVPPPPGVTPPPAPPIADTPPPAPAPAPAPSPEPAAPVAPAPATAPAPSPAPSPSAEAQGGWVIQLGSFSSAGNADGLRQTLRTQGYNAYTRSVQVDGRTITRVYVGPVVDREGANRLRDELARRHDNKGLVVAHDASTRAQ